VTKMLCLGHFELLYGKGAVGLKVVSRGEFPVM
jgi:hypothetical protein